MSVGYIDARFRLALRGMAMSPESRHDRLRDAWTRLQLIEHEGQLLGIEWIDPQLFRARPVLGAPQHGDDRFQPGDLFLVGGLGRFHGGNLGFMGRNLGLMNHDRGLQRQALLLGRYLLGMGSSDHRLEGVNIIGKLLRIGRDHACKMAQNAPDCLSFCASESVCRRLLPSRLWSAHRHRPDPFPVHAIDQGQQLGMA